MDYPWSAAAVVCAVSCDRDRQPPECGYTRAPTFARLHAPSAVPTHAPPPTAAHSHTLHLQQLSHCMQGWIACRGGSHAKGCKRLCDSPPWPPWCWKPEAQEQVSLRPHPARNGCSPKRRRPSGVPVWCPQRANVGSSRAPRDGVVYYQRGHAAHPWRSRAPSSRGEALASRRRLEVS
eukprot:6955679-Prymnesium_polylepis.1